MTPQFYKNCKNFTDLINVASTTAIFSLPHIDAFCFLKKIPQNLTWQDCYARIINELSELTDLEKVTVDREAMRLVQLKDFRTDDIDAFIKKKLEEECSYVIGDFNSNLDFISQLIWLRINAYSIFIKIETIYLTDFFRGKKKFHSYNIRINRKCKKIHWGKENEGAFTKTVSRILHPKDELKKSTEITYFDMQNTCAESISSTHYIVVQHPGKMRTLRYFKDSKVDLMQFIPALEATLVYETKDNIVHVLLNNTKSSRAIAEEFVRIFLDQECSFKPVEPVLYVLNRLKEPIDWSEVSISNAHIIDPWVSSVTFALGETSHKVTIKLDRKEDIWSVCSKQYGERHPLACSSFVHKAELSLTLSLRGRQNAQSLSIQIEHTGKSNLPSFRDPHVRTSCQEILTAVGLTKEMCISNKILSKNQLYAEIALLEFNGPVVERYYLRQKEIPVDILVSQGILKIKPPGNTITVRVEEPSGEFSLRKLDVFSANSSYWAEDPLSGERINLSKNDLCQYTVNIDYLRERLTLLLEKDLKNIPLVNNDFFLHIGDYIFEGKSIPVILGSRLWDPKVICKIESGLRYFNYEFSIVLSTSHDKTSFYINRGIVVPIINLIKIEGEKAAINFSALNSDIRRYYHLPSVTTKPELQCNGSRCALLIGPWPRPWSLNKKEWIDVVGVLVNAWNSGQRALTKDQIASRSCVDFRTMNELFRGSKDWQSYIRAADQNIKHRLWELNVGRSDLFDKIDTNEECSRNKQSEFCL